MQEVLKGAKTCNLESHEYSVLGKKTKVIFDIFIHRTEGLLDLVHMNAWRLTKMVLLGGYQCFVCFVDDFSRHYWINRMKQKFEILNLFVK